MYFNFFEIHQIIPLIISGILLIASILIFNYKSKVALILLFVGSLGLGYFIANLDPFLILWDEQFHALVAKNLSLNPFEPTLYIDPLLPYNYTNWTANHIWLHKQPLFLWQMALSIKLFGLNEMAIRIPSIIMHAIIPLFIYRIGSIALNKRSGYYGALFFAVAYFPLELVAGRYSTDHNDIAFLFYVLGSFWSWFEYKNSKNAYWLLLIGFFSGGAVLNKWLLGLLIYVVWLISELITNTNERLKIKTYLPIIYSGLISLMIFLPWQIYTNIKFPKEAAHEFALNAKHFIAPIEGHNGDLWFHFTDGFKVMYGSGVLMPFLLLFSLVFMLYKLKEDVYKVAIIIAIIVVYALFTIAETKMIAFTLLISPFVYFGIGVVVDSLLSFISERINKPILIVTCSILIPLAISFTALNMKRIQNNHTMWKPHDNYNRVGELIEMKLINTITKKKLNRNYVIFNANITSYGHIPLMFYTKHTAYSYIPSSSQIKTLKSLGKKIAVINLGTLPGYIIEDEEIRLLELEKVNLFP